jgi:hypothetical protein
LATVNVQRRASVLARIELFRAVDEATERAKRDLKKEIRADAREMERAVDQA